MSLLFRIPNRQLLRYVGAQKSMVMLARPVTMKSSPAPPLTEEGYDSRNMKIGRPMSPHLTIYKPQLTAMLSITHRGTGMALGFYLIGLSVGALVLPHDISYYLDSMQDIGWFTHFVGKMFIAFPFCYHFFNGIRHLSWDMGKLLTIKEVYTSGYAMVGIASLVSIAMSV